MIDNDSLEVVGRREHEGFEFPHGLATRESADEVLLAATTSSRLFFLDAANDEIEEVLRTHQKYSHMVAVSNDETTAYVANIEDDNVTVVDCEAREILDHFDVGEGPEGIGVGPDGRVFVANQEDDTLSIVDPDDPEDHPRLPLGTTPIRVVFSPDDRCAFVPNRESDDVSVIDLEHERGDEVRPWEIKRIPVGVWPGGTVFAPDGSRAFVANNKTNDVSVIDVDTLEEIDRFDAGIHPDGIALVPR